MLIELKKMKEDTLGRDNCVNQGWIMFLSQNTYRLRLTKLRLIGLLNSQIMPQYLKEELN